MEDIYKIVVLIFTVSNLAAWAWSSILKKPSSA